MTHQLTAGDLESDAYYHSHRIEAQTIVSVCKMLQSKFRDLFSLHLVLMADMQQHAHLQGMLIGRDDVRYRRRL